jgi:formate/nitrite transporter FocA (FNT family)
MGFVALGREHTIANMFSVPAVLLSGLDATWGDFRLGNLIPVTLGNIVGGALFIGLAFAWIYPRTAADVSVERDPRGRGRA